MSDFSHAVLFYSLKLYFLPLDDANTVTLVVILFIFTFSMFKIEHHYFQVSLFADDTKIHFDENSFRLKCVFDILDHFGKKSGCKMNLTYAFL